MNKETVLQKKYSTSLASLQESLAKVESIVVSNSDGIYFLQLSHILFCTSCNSYTEFFTQDNRRIVVSQSLKYYDEVLSPYGFFRIHQSTLINVFQLKQIDKTNEGYVALMQGDRPLAIARQKKQAFINFLRLHSIEKAEVENKYLLNKGRK